MNNDSYVNIVCLLLTVLVFSFLGFVWQTCTKKEVDDISNQIMKIGQSLDALKDQVQQLPASQIKSDLDTLSHSLDRFIESERDRYSNLRSSINDLTDHIQTIEESQQEMWGYMSSHIFIETQPPEREKCGEGRHKK